MTHPAQAAPGRGGRYRHCLLNDFGFRHGRMSIEPRPGTQRVIVLGASEAFGLYEAAGHEFPAQLGERLKDRRFEVINAALTGLTLASSIHYWESWVSRFKPAVVVIYPSPLFYLRDSPPTTRRAGSTAPKASASRQPPDRSMPLFSVRFVDRVRDL